MLLRANLDNWDSALVDALARNRRVVTFGIIAPMARDASAFLEALELGAVDLLGFSIGASAVHPGGAARG